MKSLLETFSPLTLLWYLKLSNDGPWNDCFNFSLLFKTALRLLVIGAFIDTVWAGFIIIMTCHGRYGEHEGFPCKCDRIHLLTWQISIKLLFLSKSSVM